MSAASLAQERWRRLGRLADLPIGGVPVLVDEVDLALIRTRANELFLVQGRCPHQGGPLAEGAVGAASVTCPWHRWLYDLRTGRRDDRNGSPIDTYPVRTRDGWVEAVPDTSWRPTSGVRP